MKKDECPCKWKACKRRGDCGACRAYHAAHPKYKRPFCEKRPPQKEKKESKTTPALPMEKGGGGFFGGVRPVLPCSAHKRRAIPSTFPPGRWDCSGPRRRSRSRR